LADDAPLSASLGASELAAVAAIWKREGRAFTGRFGGVSMLPTIAPGAPLEIVCGDDAEPGDVILFLHRGQVVVHRLLAFRRRWMLTRGDANAVPDLPIRRDALVGRVAGAGHFHETRAQRISRAIIVATLAIGAPLAGWTVPILWQLTRARELWRRYGVIGLLARLWSKTLGSLLDVDVVMTVRITPPPAIAAIPGYRFERVGCDAPAFFEAARLLAVDARKRMAQEVFIAIDERDGSVAACSFSDRLDGTIAHQRGISVDARHRGHSLGPTLLQYQAAMLALEGAAELEVHVSVTNRASRAMLRKAGARTVDRWLIFTLLRRFRMARRLAVRATSSN
jgi:ribosomal protein S18 acetylase RimI-like enzyme